MLADQIHACRSPINLRRLPEHPNERGCQRMLPTLANSIRFMHASSLRIQAGSREPHTNSFKPKSSPFLLRAGYRNSTYTIEPLGIGAVRPRMGQIEGF